MLAQEGRELRRAPSQRERARAPQHLTHAHAQQPLGAFERLELRAVPQHFGVARQVQQIAALVVDEEQPRARIQAQVAERVEEAVAGEVGHGQRVDRAAAIDAHEAGLAAAMRDIDPVRRSVVTRFRWIGRAM